MFPYNVVEIVDFGFYDVLNILGHLSRFLQWARNVRQILLRGSNFGLRFFYVP